MKSNEPTPRNVLVIRKLNDQARRSMQGVVLTRGVAALPPHVLVSALKAIAEFDDFNLRLRFGFNVPLGGSHICVPRQHLNIPY